MNSTRIQGQVSNSTTLNNQQQQQQQAAAAAQQQQQRFPDFLDTLPASNVDFGSNNNGSQQQQQSTGGTAIETDLVPSLPDSLGQEFDVDTMLSHVNVKSESMENGMIWL